MSLHFSGLFGHLSQFIPAAVPFYSGHPFWSKLATPAGGNLDFAPNMHGDVLPLTNTAGT
jgi:hypothetical protein